RGRSRSGKRGAPPAPRDRRRRLSRGDRPPPHPQGKADQHTRHPEQHHGDARGGAVCPVREAPPDVELHHARRIAGSTRGEDVHVGEHPGEHRDHHDHRHQLDDRPDLRHQHSKLQAPPARAVDARGLGRLGRKREQRGGEHDHGEAQLLPDHEPTHRHDREARAPEPVLRQRPQVDFAQRRVEDAVLVPAPGDRRPQHGAARSPPGAAGAGLARELASRDRVGGWARDLAAAGLCRGRVHRRAARASARDGRGRAHRRRGLVEPAASSAGAADPAGHRAGDGDHGDHGVHLRVHPHLGWTRLCVERDGALHLAELLERGKRHRRERRRDAARDGECVDRPFPVGAAEGGRRVRAGAGGLVGLVARHAFLIVICLAALYPLWFIVTTALKSNADYQLDPTGFPFHPTLDSLRTMVSDEPLPRWMWNSFLVTVSSVAVSTLVALLAAYAAVFGRFRGHKIFLSTSVALMVVPPVTLLVPMFVFMVDTGWVNHLQSVIVFYTGLLVPFGVFFLSSFFRTVPEELIEAASVEGAGPFTVLRRIVLPLSGAAAFTLVIVQSIWVWNELLIALVFLQNDEARTLMSGLAQFQ